MHIFILRCRINIFIGAFILTENALNLHENYSNNFLLFRQFRHTNYINIPSKHFCRKIREKKLLEAAYLTSLYCCVNTFAVEAIAMPLFCEFCYFLLQKSFYLFSLPHTLLIL